MTASIFTRREFLYEAEHNSALHALANVARSIDWPETCAVAGLAGEAVNEGPIAATFQLFNARGQIGFRFWGEWRYVRGISFNLEYMTASLGEGAPCIDASINASATGRLDGVDFKVWADGVEDVRRRMFNAVRPLKELLQYYPKRAEAEELIADAWERWLPIAERAKLEADKPPRRRARRRARDK